MKRFKNRTVIITGGARGMGASHARGFVAEGANVVIADVLEEEGRMLAAELGDRAIFSRLNVTSEADWGLTVAAAEDAFGPVSVLVNNAGIVRTGVIAETEPATWRQAGGGAIVNTSAGAGMIGQFGAGAYVASKWGVRGLTKTAALELARDNIRVNSIHPGNVRTPMVAGSEAAAVGAGIVRDLAIPRIAEPEEITQLVLFVASIQPKRRSKAAEQVVAGPQTVGSP